MTDFVFPLQEAYEALSSSGLVRPAANSNPLLYAISIKEFNSPEFTLGKYASIFLMYNNRLCGATRLLPPIQW